MQRKIVFFIIIGMLIYSCKKTTHESLHENHVVDGNLLPYYNGVSTIKIQSYINKLYVDLIGREPTSIELNNSLEALTGSNLSLGSKDSLIDNLMNSNEFYIQLYLKTSGNMLNSTDKQAIADQINFFTYLYNFNLQNLDTVSANALLVQNYNLTQLYQADSLYKLKQIDINEYYRRFIMNYFYDEINMGAENYVKACFENLFYRLPTTNELNQGVGMVNGLNPNILFLQSGNSKGDFAFIVTHCNQFYEGLITTAYTNYLLRKPTDVEINATIQKLSLNKDYLGFLKSIVDSKEYSGF